MTDRRALVRAAEGVPAARLAPIGLLLALAVAWVVPQPGGIRLGDSGQRGEATAAAVEATLEALPANSVVALGFDADVGTYPEIRATVRTLVAQLLERDIVIAAVSLTPEGRALMLAELGRLARAGVADASIVDLGFLPGAEAALVELTRGGLPSGTAEAQGAFPRGVLAVADLAVVVGGNDLSPRAWVEQVLPRVDDLPLVVVAPTVLLPELLPFAETGQIDALLIGPRDGAAYRAGAAIDGPPQPDGVTEAEPRSLPVLIGLLIAVVVLVHAITSAVLQRARSVARAGE